MRAEKHFPWIHRYVMILASAEHLQKWHGKFICCTVYFIRSIQMASILH